MQTFDNGSKIFLGIFTAIIDFLGIFAGFLVLPNPLGILCFIVVGLFTWFSIICIFSEITYP
jgi:hypothetical protein